MRSFTLRSVTMTSVTFLSERLQQNAEIETREDFSKKAEKKKTWFTECPFWFRFVTMFWMKCLRTDTSQKEGSYKILKQLFEFFCWKEEKIKKKITTKTRNNVFFLCERILSFIDCNMKPHHCDHSVKHIFFDHINRLCLFTSTLPYMGPNKSDHNKWLKTLTMFTLSAFYYT